MKVLELFAGTRSIGRAFEAKGHEVFSVEWDKKFENIDLYKDISQLTADEVLEKFGIPDVVWMSPDCFPAGTLVWTNKGYVPIENINCFDMVLTHENRYKMVYATQKTNKYDMYSVKISGCESVLVSSEHPYYARRKVRVNTHRKGESVVYTKLDSPKWLAVKDLSTDYKVGIPINQNSIIPVWLGCEYEYRNSYGRTHSWIQNQFGSYMGNDKFWWIVGRYFGDGCLSMDKCCIDISCAFDEIDEIQPMLDSLEIKYSLYKKITAAHFVINSKELCIFLQQFGVGAEAKQITPMILDLPVTLLQSFMMGYISADGCWQYDVKNPYCTITTISRRLAYGLQLCILKAFSRYASMVVCQHPNNVICGRTVNVKPSYTLSFYRDYTKRAQYVIEDGMAWVNVRGVEKLPATQTTLYNISVLDDESFTANNIVVHNCTSYSVAAISHHRQLDPKTGNLDPKTDYAKFCDNVNQHCLSLVNELKPKFWFIENPRGGLRSMTFMQGLPRYTVSYCQYGDDRQKPTDIWTNHPDPKFKPLCKPGAPCHVAAPRGSRTGTQGLANAVERSRIPQKLCEHIVDICEEYFKSQNTIHTPEFYKSKVIHYKPKRLF